MKRYKDVITGSTTQPEELYVLKDFPVNMLSDGKTEWNRDIVYDMRFGIFPDSGVIQLLDLVPEELVYIDTHSNAIGAVWKRQHEKLSSIIEHYIPDKVLEIGGATGVLERTYNSLASRKTSSWLIIDPEPNPINTKAKFIKGFFPEAVPKGIEFDIIVHSHTWEHAYSSRSFIENISKVMTKGQRMIFSIPNLKYLMENSMTSIINFEHTVYLTDDYVEYLLAEFGFDIEKKFYFENHSVIYVVVKTGAYNSNLKALYNVNKTLFLQYIDTHKEKMKKLNSIIKAKSRCYLFGGHITTQFYFAFGLDQNLICGILDNDIYKHGKRVSGTPWIIESPLKLKKIDCPTVIVPSGPYTEEIKGQITNEINSNIDFVDIGLL